MNIFHNNVVKLTTNTDGYRSNDNVKAQFGDSSDLEIFHDGSHSRIKDTGTGGLYTSASIFKITNAAVTENMFLATLRSDAFGSVSSSSRGGSFITSEWRFSMPSATAGGPSIRRLITSNCVTVSGNSHPNRKPEITINKTAATFVEI